MSQYDPFDEIERLLGEFGDQFDVDGGEIPVDVLETDEEFRVSAAVAGVEPDDVEVTLHDGHRLTIETHHESTVEAVDGEYVRRERRRGDTSRTVSLPAPVDEDSASATVEAGVLTVTVAKATGDGDGTEIPVN